MLYYITISVLVVLLISFGIHFVNFQKTRCRYSESGSDGHDWGLWEANWDEMFQYRECDCCHFIEVRSLDAKKK
jgi:hypothetical protein